MNRHFVSLLFLSVLVTSITSCAGADSASLHSAITAEINGESTSIPVTLYKGSDYSIYIPDEGRDMSRQLDEGDYWVNTENEQVFLNIVMHPGQTPEDAREDILFSCEGFTFEEMDAKNHFSGEDSFTEQMVDVWLLETHCGTLIVWGEYPFSEMGGFKSYLTAIIDTLQITD